MTTKKSDDRYTAREWRAFRARMLKKMDPICSDCHKHVVGSDITLDHILPVSKHPDLFLDEGNVRVLCRTCNGRKSDLIDVRNDFINPKYLRH